MSPDSVLKRVSELGNFNYLPSLDLLIKDVSIDMLYSLCEYGEGEKYSVEKSAEKEVPKIIVKFNEKGHVVLVCLSTRK